MSVLYVTTAGAYVRKSGGRIAVTQGERELASVPLVILESVVLFGPVQISTQAMQELLGSGVSVLLLSRSGKFLGMLNSGLPKNVFVRLAQQEAAIDSKLALANAHEVVAAKIASQQRSLARWRMYHWLESGELPSDYRGWSVWDHAGSVSDLQLQEARIARSYYESFGLALPPPFYWQGRSRRPPRDPVNALLSLTYMCMVGEAVAACYAAGLDPYVGFLHQLYYGRPSFALNLIEPLRAYWCDHFVLSLLQREEFCERDFVCTEKNGCHLSQEAIVRFFRCYGNWIDGSGSTPRKVIAKLALDAASAVKAKVPLRWSKVMEAV